MKKILPYCTLLTRVSLILLVIMLQKISGYAQTPDFGNSYINITKGLNGGTIETGDTLEIRATFVVRTGTFDSCGFTATIPAGTTYITQSLRVLSNEGQVYRNINDSTTDSDQGWISGSSITLHLGFGATTPATKVRRGTIKNTDHPSFYNSACIMVVAFRVKVTAATGSTINTGGQQFTYKLHSTAGTNPLLTQTFPTNLAMVYPNSGVCPNSIGANSLGTEFNGTFGTGKPRNRSTALQTFTSYIFQNFGGGSPQDYNYGIANNTSVDTQYTTSNAWAKPDKHRVFGVWDIIGDHTGAVSPTLGNAAADTVANANAGYMLVINSAYKTDTAFKHTIKNLCPNTYYEISAWFRNICSKCACDTGGHGATGAGYIPWIAGDSSGVRPNLTIELDGVDYYTTGNMPYTGLWVKKGFTFLTGPAQDSFVMHIRNNAPGGGGNDWAIDDISVATCTPNLNLQPSPNVNVCYGNQVDLFAIIASYFSNYLNWSWERSNDNGVTWNSTGISGTGSPTLVGGQWQYQANYPSFLGDSSVNHAMFRIKVASTPSNLASVNCSFTAATTIHIWVNNCGQLLQTNLLSLQGSVVNNLSNLKWTVDNEASTVEYHIESSDDKAHFQEIAVVPASPSNNGVYNYIDYKPLVGARYYRIRMVEGQVQNYSKVIYLSNGQIDFSVKSLINPFKDKISFDLVSPDDGPVTLSLVDMYGRMVRQEKITVQQGLNSVQIMQLSQLQSGIYILKIQKKDQIITERLMKSAQ